MVFHKSDLTIDAVVKLYASGFLIAAPTAMIIEGILLSLLLFVGYIITGIVYLVSDSELGDSYVIIWFCAEIMDCYNSGACGRIM